MSGIHQPISPVSSLIYKGSTSSGATAVSGGVSACAGSRFLGFQEEIPVNYTFTIIENVSTEKAQECYWNFSQWADLWTTWRPVIEDRLPLGSVTLQVLTHVTCKPCNN